MAVIPPVSEPIARRLSGLAAERPRDESPHGVLVSLRTVQHAVISRGPFGPSWSPRMTQVKWVLSGAGEMEVGGRRQLFVPGQVAVYLPTIPHRFWAVEPENEFCWFTIDGPFAEQLPLELGLQPGIYPAQAPSVAMIHEMAASLEDHTIQGRRRSSLLAIQAWYQLADSIRIPEPDSIITRAQALLSQGFADPEMSASSVARALGYHRGSLSRLFHRQTGETIIGYLTEVRLQAAKSLLRRTNLAVAEVGRQCGFRDNAYFCRWFRKHVRCSPGEYRQREGSVSAVTGSQPAMT